MFNLFSAEAYKIFNLELRYPLNFFSGLIMLTLLFYGLLLGAKHLTGVESFGKNLDGALIGYAVWMMALSGLNNMPTDIQADARRGTLENLFLSFHDISVVFMMRSIVGSLIGLVFTGISVAILLWLTEISVSFSSYAVFPVLTVLAGSIGLGFMAGGVALQAKQIGQVLNIAQYPLLFLIMTPFESLPQELINMAVFLPVVPSAMTLREIMVFDKSLMDSYFLIGLINATVYLYGGLMIFRYFVNKVKLSGGLSGY